jgi:hypothetical protein
MTCWEEGDFFFGGGGAGCLQLGRVEMRKKTEKSGSIGSSERGYINFCRRLHRRTIPSMISSAPLMANRARHRTALPFWIPRWFHRHFLRWIGHVTIRSWHFESFSDSVGIFIGESVTSPYGADVLNSSVIPSVKNTRNNLHVSEPPFFFNSQHSVRNFIGKYRRLNISMNFGRRYLPTKVPTE